MKAFSLAVVLLTGVVGAAWASDKDKPKKDAPVERAPQAGAERKFSEAERREIGGYVKLKAGEGKKGRGLPPGLAKKVARGGKLPPGWEGKLVVGQMLPVEIFQQCQPLPRELSVRLPVPPVGTVTVAIQGRVVRLIEATREILDVFELLP